MMRTTHGLIVVLLLVSAMLLAVEPAPGGGAEPVPFEDCGEIVFIEHDGVIVTAFETHNGQMFILDTTLGLGDGAEACLAGTVSSCDVPGFPVELDGCVTVTAIVMDAVDAGPIGTGIVTYGGMCGAVDVSGGIAGTPLCVIFTSDFGAVYRLDGEIPTEILDGGADQVNVSGVVVPGGCDGACGEVDGCVSDPQITPCPVLGDLTGDFVVNGIDLGTLLAQWGQSASTADLNADGTVNGMDLGILLSNWTIE